MSGELSLLITTAATIGCLHALLGVDHYLPIIVLSRARRWSLAKTTWVTTLCGLGHVLSSIVLGAVGIGLGLTVSRLAAIDAGRGGLAAWLLIGGGSLYSAWGLFRAFNCRDTTELSAASAMASDVGGGGVAWTPSMLFVVLFLGPCEPLVPVLMAPAAMSNAALAVGLVAVVFAVATMATMLAAVLLGTLGLSLVPLGRFERFGHALAGAAVLVCGLSLKLFV